jgi:hypothetical protein
LDQGLTLVGGLRNSINMDTLFRYVIFLSYSSQDEAMVRPLAERLRKDRFKVWFEDLAGNSIPAKLEEGLERLRVLVFCISANAFGLDSIQLESSTFRFHDPLNKVRRFLPMRRDDAPTIGSNTLI